MLKKLKDKLSKNCASCPADDADPMQKALFREVEEDLQKEQLKKIWEKYSTLIIIVVIAGLSFAAGFEGWKAWLQEMKQRDSIAYENAQILIEEQKFDEALKALEELAQKAKTGYAVIAAMEKASLLIKTGDLEEGLSILETIYHNKKIAKPYRDLAGIKLAGQILDDGKLDKILSLVDPLTYPNSAWRSLAMEIKALLYVRENQKEQALNYFNSIISDNAATQRVRARAVEMVSVLEKNY